MSDNFKGVLKQANNDVTGDAIRTGKGGNEKFAAGWELAFGKKPKEPSPEVLEMFRKIGQGDWSMEAAYEAFKDVPPRDPTNTFSGGHDGMMCEECDLEMHPFACSFTNQSGWSCDGCGWSVDND